MVQARTLDHCSSCAPPYATLADTKIDRRSNAKQLGPAGYKVHTDRAGLPRTHCSLRINDQNSAAGFRATSRYQRMNNLFSLFTIKNMPHHLVFKKRDFS